MKPTTLLPAAFLALAPIAHADTFGSGANTFTIDFVTVGNPGNPNDPRPGPGSYGGVSSTFRMGVYEVSQEMVAHATNEGMTNVVAGAWTADRPAANMSWYEAAAFVNWLNTSTGHQAAYNLTYSGGWNMSLWSSDQAWQITGQNLYRHKDAFYFLPAEDEWYKAAYHENDGVTANYREYPMGSNADGIDFAGDANFQSVFSDGYDQGGPNAINNAGAGASAYGTYGQGGNVWEWMESALDHTEDSASEDRAIRGGSWFNLESSLHSSHRLFVYTGPESSFTWLGFRVASIPEPGSAALLAAGALGVLRRRR